MSEAATPATTDKGTRCFVALVPDAASREALLACRETFGTPRAGMARGVRWLDATSLHLTLRFFGESTRAQVEYFKHELTALAIPLPAIDTRRWAIWPNRARPRLLVLELDPPDALLTLAHECEALARKSGFTPEPRAFRAHLTLARLRPGCALEIPSAPLPTLAFESLALMRSDLQSAGARYRALASAPLPATAKC